jgi:membrane-associated phospholipid phosphatase
MTTVAAPFARRRSSSSRVEPPSESKLQVVQRVADEQTVSVPAALARGRTGTYAAAVGMGGFLAIFALVRARRSDEIDLAIMIRIQARRHPRLAAMMEAASWPGFPPQSRVLPLGLAGGLWLLRLRTEAAFQLLAWGTAAISTAVKAMIRRPRPLPEQVRVVLAPLGGSSFPSGHVITYVGTYGFMAYLAYTLVRPPQLRWPATFGLLGLIGLVGPSRIYQGHHWPTDVAASYLLGLSYLIALTTLYRRVRGSR